MNNDSGRQMMMGFVFIAVCVSIGLLIFFANDDAVSNQSVESGEGVADNEYVDVIDSDSLSEDRLLDPEFEEPTLSYQEDLRRNGDVDGRSKDYWSVDENGNEDHEFGGAKVGMLYTDFRDRLEFVGFIPKPVNRDEICKADPDNVECDHRYIQSDFCGGAEQELCSYGWSKGRKNYTVFTREEKVVKMSFDR